MASLFNIGVSGLKAQQAALSVVGQNITNASTPGYSRQRVELEAATGASTGVGAGVTVGDIKRITDSFVNEQIRIDTSLYSELESFGTRINQLQGGLFDSEFGIDAALRDFFAALSNAANEPADMSAREFVLSSAEALVNRFHGVAERTRLQEQEVTSSLQSGLIRVNEISGLLVGLNDRIAGLQGQSEAAARNSLLDKRDELLKELSQYLSVTTSEQADGQVNVFIGKGQPLVLGQDFAELQLGTGGDITIQPVGSDQPQVITSSLNGGEIGGILKYRSEVLWPTQNTLGQLAATFATAMNQQHSLGVDIQGRVGAQLFRDINDPALVSSRVEYLGGASGGSSGTGTINVYVDDPFVADAADYEIHFSETAPGSFIVQRREDGEVVHRGTSFTVPSEMSFEGVRVEFASGQVNPGDSFVIRPYERLSSDMSLLLSDPSTLALSSPVSVNSDPANNGTAEMTVREILDPNHPVFDTEQALMPPVLVEFVSDTEYRLLDNSNPAEPVRLQPDLGLFQILPGAENHLLPYQLGTTVVTSSGPAESAIQLAPGYVSDFTPAGNGYPSGSITIGQGADNSIVSVTSDMSARQIAQLVTAQEGVRASASTEVELSNLVDYQSGTDVQVIVNGQVFSGFNDLGELADMINADEGMMAEGTRAVSDGHTLRLENVYGEDLNLHFQGDANESITLTSGSETAQLRGSVPGSYSHATIGGRLSLLIEPDYQVSSDLPGLMASQPQQTRADFGFDVVLSGNVSAGDRFELSFNQGGVGDNRNALNLAQLADASLTGDPPRSFFGMFASMVQEVGVQAGQVEINKQAAQALVSQSEAFRESISGVNLDEEAALLIRHEQAYNAAAQVISVARDIFNILLNSVS